MYLQRSLDELGTPLAETTFCVLDVETTGTNATNDLICEIGAVKVRGGEVLGTFQTLVNPGRAIPPRISVITGLTDAIVAPAPRIEQVLGPLRRFLGDSVFVAHNASFDLGFVRAAFARAGHDEYRPTVVDTLALARRLVRSEVRDCRLGTLAERFSLSHRPSHRALDDALATCDLLHLLIERAAGWGVMGLDDLIAVCRLTGHPQAGKLHLTTDLPRSPGVYLMTDAIGEVTYVGKATNLRQRVRSYFGGDERRTVGPMLRDLHRVAHVPTVDTFEAEVLEQRLIGGLMPRYNRAGRRRRRPVHVRLDTVQEWPRLSVVSDPEAPGLHLGPLSGRRIADEVVDALHDAFPIRRCTTRIGPRFTPDPSRPPCTPAQLGVAPCPCTGTGDRARHDDAVRAVARVIEGDLSEVIALLEERMTVLAAAQRFEEAASTRDRLRTLLDASLRSRLVGALVGAGRVRLRIGRAVHLIEDGQLVLPGATRDAIPSGLREAALTPVDPNAEMLLIARALQRRSTTGADLEVLECSGSWTFPIEEPTVERLGASPSGADRDPSAIDADLVESTAGED
ncbi:MAG: putative polymerase epsilon subunit [Actinomycetota bacterium]